MTDSLKDELLQLLANIWKSDDFKLSDTERARSLRLELLMRALSVVMTDDERAQLYGLPKGCRMRENAKILVPDKLACGDHVWIGEGAIVDASGGMEIGDHTTLGTGSYIWSHSSVMANVMMDNRSGNPYIVRSKTRIGSGTFIGGPSVVYAGVSIGDRCIVMPMSVVTSDVPDNTMVGGSPAKFIKQIDGAYIERFKATLTQRPDGRSQL